MNKQTLILFSGAVCALSGLVAACGPTGPIVIPFQPPREPITALDTVEAGETELSGNVGVGVTTPIGLWGAWNVQVADPALISPWTLGLNHGLERVELRVLVGRHLLSHQASVGVGYRLPSAGRWNFIADAALAASRFESRFEVPSSNGADTANGDFDTSPNPSFQVRDPGYYDYAYWITAPSVRARAVYQASPQLAIPLALRISHSRTGFGYGLYDFEQHQINYVELTAGAIWTPEKSCFSLGAGLTVNVLPYVDGLISASASCTVDWREMRR